MKTIKVVLNRCYGGFTLSDVALGWLGFTEDEARQEFADGQNRDNPALVECVEILSSEMASGVGSKLEVVEFEFDLSDFISEYDGFEDLRIRG